VQNVQFKKIYFLIKAFQNLGNNLFTFGYSQSSKSSLNAGDSQSASCCSELVYQEYLHGVFSLPLPLATRVPNTSYTLILLQLRSLKGSLPLCRLQRLFYTWNCREMTTVSTTFPENSSPEFSFQQKTRSWRTPFAPDHELKSTWTWASII